MKPSFLSTTAAAGLALLAGPGLVDAANVSLTASDALNTSSLNSAGKWSNAQAPSAGNDYFTASFFARTPTSGNVTFAGNSLTLQTPSGQSSPMRSLLFKGGNGAVIIINNLTNAGGIINLGSGSTAVPLFTGNLMTIAANSTIQADQASMFIGYPLAGSATLTNTSGNACTITYTNNNSAFTGRFIITNNVSVAFSSVNGGLGNPASPMPDQILLGTGCTLLDYAGITLGNPNGGITLGGNSTINASGTNGSTTISEPITDNGGGFNLIKRGSGTLTLAGNNTFNGGLSLYGISVGGRLNLNSPTAWGVGTFTINNGNNALLDNTSGSALTLANNNPQTWQNNFAFIGSSSLDMGAGTVNITGNLSVTVSNNTLSVGQLSDGGAGYGLTKQGAGKLLLNGGGAYFGATTVSAGTLALSGTGATLYSTSITVASNAVLDVSGAGGLTLQPSAVLTGAGTVIGSLTDGGSSVILPGGTSAAGTLTINGNLNLNGGTSISFDLSSTPTAGSGINDLIIVSGALNLAGPTTIAIAGTPVAGTYTLFQYDSLAGSLANLSVPLGYTLNNNTTAKTIELIATHVPAQLTWKGDGLNNVWDTATTANFLQGGSPVDFYIGDSVTFDDTGSFTPAINLSGAISPTSTTVNSANTYDFTGGPIVSGSLTKSGSGTLILEATNTYPGPTVINGGTLQVGNGLGGSLGSGPITNNATLAFNLSVNDVTISTPIKGTGSIVDSGGANVTLAGSVSGSSLTMSGSGNLILSASNSYSGLTTVSGGYLHPRDPNALGSSSAGTVVQYGGQVFADVNIDFTNETFTLNGSGPAGDGALHKGGAGVTTISTPVTLGSDAMINVDGGSTLNFSNVYGIDGALANANLTLAGSGAGNIPGPLALGTGGLTVSGGTWTVAPTNNYFGPTALNGGSLRISYWTALGFNPNITMAGGALEAVTNLTLDSGGSFSLTLNANGVLAVDPGATLTIAKPITGAGGLTKWLGGTLLLTAANTFSGNFYTDGGSGSANDGITRITSAAALGGVPVNPGVPSILIRNNNSGYSTLQLDGSTGPITLAQEFGISCRNNANPTIENLAGTNTLNGNIQMGSGGNRVNFVSDAGLLILSGTNLYTGTLVGTRSNSFGGAGNVLVSGPILNPDPAVNASQVHLDKAGTGTLTLAAQNSYAGSTMINGGLLNLTGSLTSTGGVFVVGGTLGGSGVINDSVTIQTGGTLAPGVGLGTLTINGGLVLLGTTAVEVSKNAGNDHVAGLTNLVYGGALVVSNVSGTLNIGDTFTLFSSAASSGNFTSVSGDAGSGKAFSFNPANGVLSVVQGTATTPTNLTWSLTGGNLSLSWPASYQGWYAQSNAVDVTSPTAWYDIPGSQNGTSLTIPVSLAQPKVFYRLRKP